MNTTVQAAQSGAHAPDQVTVTILPQQEPPTPTEVDWAAHHLGELLTLISFSNKPVEEIQSDGYTWRLAGHINASPGTVNRFRIWLRVGATEADLSFLERVVAAAQQGRFLRWGWRSVPYQDGQTIYRYEMLRRANPGTSPALVPCTEPACREGMHDEDWVHHVADEINGDKWSITVEMAENITDQHGWVVNVFAEDVYADPDKVSRLAGDIQWAAAEARKLNAARALQEVTC